MQIDNDRQVIVAVESAQRRMIAEASMNSARFIAPPPSTRVAQASSDEPGTDADEAFATRLPWEAPPVRPYLLDAQIDAIARRFLSKLPVGNDFEEAWAVYAASLESAVPTQARAEIKERAKALLGHGSEAA